jgi:putative tryptophan/tyrosine transport system substrate-binding protein
VKRREFITLIGGAAAAWPLAARAQHADRVLRIAVLMGLADGEEGKTRVSALRQGLLELGWAEGRNVQFDIRLAGGDVRRMESNAVEVAGSAPDVVVATSHATIKALRQVNSSVPIVFVLVANVVESGLVESQARPGRNITGFTNFEPAIAGKWLEVLKEAAPQIRRAVALFSPETSLYGLSVPYIEAAGAQLGVRPTAAPVRNAAAIEQTIDALAREPDSGLIVMPGPLALVNRDLILTLTSQRRLPAIYPYRTYSEAGGLISYGIDVRDLFRRSGSYVDRILRGENAGDLPIQAPTKYELVINLKTAKALGLTVPDSLLARADEVIE